MKTSDRIVWAIAVLISLAMFLFMQTQATAFEAPKEPPIETYRLWFPVADGNIVIEYGDSGPVHGIRFKHEVVGNPYPFPQCNRVQRQGDDIWLLSNGQRPVLYAIKPKAKAYQMPGELVWHWLGERTSGFIKPYNNSNKNKYHCKGKGYDFSKMKCRE